MKKSLQQRILDRTTIDPVSGCWNCYYATDSSGYPHIHAHTTMRKVHRVMYSLLVGEIPKGMFVLHKCIGNRRCCNPEHLYLGTHKENALDKIVQGRCNPPYSERHGRFTHPEKTARGEKAGASKLTRMDILLIRMWTRKGFSQREIAKEFGVHQYTIWSILKYKTWRHVHGRI